MKGFEPPRSTDFIPALRTKALQTGPSDGG
jgi:hypothetical protein